jgi:hypothetical protein
MKLNIKDAAGHFLSSFLQSGVSTLAMEGVSLISMSIPPTLDLLDALDVLVVLAVLAVTDGGSVGSLSLTMTWKRKHILCFSLLELFLVSFDGCRGLSPHDQKPVLKVPVF